MDIFSRSSNANANLSNHVTSSNVVSNDTAGHVQFSGSYYETHQVDKLTNDGLSALSKQQKRKLLFLRKERAKLRQTMRKRSDVKDQAINNDLTVKTVNDLKMKSKNDSTNVKSQSKSSTKTIAPDSCILSFLVFDEDTFTPDDFLGSAEIRLDNIPYNTVTDMWIPLNNVDTGHIHIKLRKCMLASPTHQHVVKKLSMLQRGITVKDLQMNNISLDQLIGQEAWINKNFSNPAIEHLVSVLMSNKIEWNLSSLHRLETILTSQHMLPTQLSKIETLKLLYSCQITLLTIIVAH